MGGKIEKEKILLNESMLSQVETEENSKEYIAEIGNKNYDLQ